MKITDLKKDGQRSVRINKKVIKYLKTKGISVQKIVDKYVDNNLKVDEQLKIRGK